MSVGVFLTKVEETSKFVLYNFGPNDTNVGQIRIDKESGNIDVIFTPLSAFYHLRATQLLNDCFSKGSYPNKLTFA